jgi:hypothetical protein
MDEIGGIPHREGGKQRDQRLRSDVCGPNIMTAVMRGADAEIDRAAAAHGGGPGPGEGHQTEASGIGTSCGGRPAGVLVGAACREGKGLEARAGVARRSGSAGVSSFGAPPSSRWMGAPSDPRTARR